MDNVEHIVYAEIDPGDLIPMEFGGGPDQSLGPMEVSLVELGKHLLLSAKDGDTAEVHALMGRGAPFSTDWLGTSPLHLAAQNGHEDTVEVLLRAGISRDARTKVDRTPLHMAAYEGHASIVQLLLSCGSNVNACDMVLHFSVCRPALCCMFQSLCQQSYVGANVMYGAFGSVPQGKSREVGNSSGSWTPRDELRMTPLHWAVEKGHADAVEVLLQHGADVRAVSKFDKTPLSIAIENNRPDILQLLQTVQCLEPLAAPIETAEDLEATLAATDSIAAKSGSIGTLRKGDPLPSIETTDRWYSLEHQLSRGKQTFSKSKFKPKVLGSIGPPRKADAQDSNTTLQLLKAHGIAMLPTDDSTLVASAVENGKTIVLTEAGKLALNLSQETIQSLVQKAVPANSPKTTAIPVNKRKVITIRTSQLFPDGQRPPNILKRVDVNKPTVSAPPTKLFVTTAGRNATIPVTVASHADLAAITKELEEARKQAEAYRELLSKKEREAEEYKKKLQSITNTI